jgi:hypothetical protein
MRWEEASTGEPMLANLSRSYGHAGGLRAKFHEMSITRLTMRLFIVIVVKSHYAICIKSIGNIDEFGRRYFEGCGIVSIDIEALA